MNIKKIKNNLKDMDKSLFIISLVFLIFGLLNIVTASSREAVSNDTGIYYYFYKHLQMMFIGFVGGFIVLQIPTSFYKKTINYLWMFIVFLVIATFASAARRGAQIWLNIGGFSFQPGEFSKPLMIVAIAILFERYYTLSKKNINKAHELVPQMFIMGLVIPLFLILQSDLGNMGIMVFTFFSMFMASPIEKEFKQKAIKLLVSIGVGGLLLLLVLKGGVLEKYQLERFNIFSPCTRYEGTGYQICNAYIAINDGGIFGLGIGKSKQKYSYIPEPHTDMIFAITAEEYGALSMTLVFIGYALLFRSLNRISKEASTIRGKYIAFGAMCYIFIQMFVNLGGLMGVIPLTGVTLPFLSYGGSFTISLIIMIALVLRVSIETKNQKIKINHI